MKITAYQTPLVHVGDDLNKIIDNALPVLTEKSVIAITSKVISLCEKRIVKKDSVSSKSELIKHHADAYFDQVENPYSLVLTIKNNLLIPSAGIDESNGENVYILYPEDIQLSAAKIWYHLRNKHHLDKLGVLITDSHTSPMRRGVTGIGLGWCGFDALTSYIGKPDLYGSLMRVTQSNNLDGLAAAAVLVMGEGSERTPLAVMTDIPRVVFQSREPTSEEVKAVTISLSEDLYGPILEKAHWVWNKQEN